MELIYSIFLLGLDYVTLGSIRQYDNFSQDICEHDSRGIWKRTTTLVPSLKKSQIVCEAVGIRPNRTKVRVEVEVIKLKGDQLQRVLSNLMKKILIITQKIENSYCHPLLIDKR